MSDKSENDTFWIITTLKIGVSSTFISHGIYAIHIKSSWIPLITSLGFNRVFACQIMPVIGFVDILVGLIILFKPNNYILIWAFIWCLLTAMSRVTAGESYLELFERFSNIAAPMALLLIRNTTNAQK